MEAAATELRTIEDQIEVLRDPSHVQNLSKSEMLNLYEMNHLSIRKCETTEIKQRLKNWLALTKTPEKIQIESTEKMLFDINGGEKTGFYPYFENEDICFNQRWVLVIGEKK